MIQRIRAARWSATQLLKVRISQEEVGYRKVGRSRGLENTESSVDGLKLVVKALLVNIVNIILTSIANNFS